MCVGKDCATEMGGESSEGKRRTRKGMARRKTKTFDGEQNKMSAKWWQLNEWLKRRQHATSTSRNGATNTQRFKEIVMCC